MLSHQQSSRHLLLRDDYNGYVDFRNCELHLAVHILPLQVPQMDDMNYSYTFFPSAVLEQREAEIDP